METKHTPGPWFIHDSLGNAVAVVAKTRIASDAQPEADTTADARLIAAAPELLTVAIDFSEALTELHLLCECGQEDCRTSRLRAAIAKATGEQQ